MPCFSRSPLEHAVFSKQYLMGWLWFVHFVAAYTFMISCLIRLYWSPADNEHADMLKWIPFARDRIKTLFDDIRSHLVLDIKSTLCIGHTTLGSFVFLYFK